MKKLAIIATALLTSVSVWAQGVVNFANGAALVDAPVTYLDGETPLSGAAFAADLYFGAVGADASALTSLGVAVPFGTGASAGYFFGGSQSIPGFDGGTTVTLQVRAWEVATGASWDASSIRGESNLITVILGGGPTPTPNMVGLESFQLVPEPSTIALGILGFGALLFRLRRK